MRRFIIFLFLRIIFQDSNVFRSEKEPEKFKVLRRGFISTMPPSKWEADLIYDSWTIGKNIDSHHLDEIKIICKRLFLPIGALLVPLINYHILEEIRSIYGKGIYKQATELACILPNQEIFIYPDTFYRHLI